MAIVCQGTNNPLREPELSQATISPSHLSLRERFPSARPFVLFARTLSPLVPLSARARSFREALLSARTTSLRESSFGGYTFGRWHWERHRTMVSPTLNKFCYRSFRTTTQGNFIEQLQFLVWKVIKNNCKFFLYFNIIIIILFLKLYFLYLNSPH